MVLNTQSHLNALPLLLYVQEYQQYNGNAAATTHQQHTTPYHGAYAGTSTNSTTNAGKFTNSGKQATTSHAGGRRPAQTSGSLSSQGQQSAYNHGNYHHGSTGQEYGTTYEYSIFLCQHSFCKYLVFA